MGDKPMETAPDGATAPPSEDGDLGNPPRLRSSATSAERVHSLILHLQKIRSGNYKPLPWEPAKTIEEMVDQLIAHAEEEFRAEPEMLAAFMKEVEHPTPYNGGFRTLGE
jgi:hypothetical protein